MKTQIIRLEAHDDIVSARDKLSLEKAERMLVVWPERGRVLTRQLDLVLLKRYAAGLGVQLALVTHDSGVRYHARRLGIPVFSKANQAKSAQWRLERRLRRGRIPTTEEKLRQAGEARSPRPLPPRPANAAPPLNPALRLALFTLGVLAVLSIGAVLFPRAQVSLQPQTKTQQVTIQVQAGAGVEKPSLAGAVPVEEITIAVEGRDQLPTSGLVSFAESAAQGRVVFTNLTDRPVKILEGSIVRSLGQPAVRFATTQEGTVAAGPGQTLTLPVRAVLPGSQGNLPAGSLVAIEGSLGTQVTADNPAPTRGGKETTLPAPSREDRSRLSARLQDSLRRTAVQELQSGLAPGDLLLTPELELARSVDEVFLPAGDQPADQLSLDLQLEFHALVASGEDLRSLAEAVLDANLEKGFAPMPDSLEIEHLTLPLASAASLRGSLRWELLASRQIQAQVGEAEAINLSLGRSPAQAGQRLSTSLPLQSPPHITLSPPWWPVLPFIPFRIEVMNVTSDQGQGTSD